MKIFALTLVLLFATAAFPQSANVIELNPTDAARAKTAYDALQKAQAEWDAIKLSTEDRYVPYGVLGHCTNNDQNRCVPDEWYRGFEFSKDFRFIVPKQPANSGTVTVGPCGQGSITWIGCNNFTTSPFITFQ